MSDRQSWLALTQEDVIEPELQLCDAHHHLWNRGNSCYLAEEFRQDFAGHNVTKSIYVECLSKYNKDAPDNLKPVGETSFIHNLTADWQDDNDLPNIAAGIIGFADLCLGAVAGEVLDAHVAASDRFRGIRHASAWDSDEKVHNAHTKPIEHLLADKTFQEGFGELGTRGLTFDAWLYFHQIPELTSLARVFPETPIIINHVGAPLGVGPYAGKRDEVYAIWKNHMSDLASCKNVSVKLGGMTMALSGFGWNKLEKPASSIELAEAMSPYYHYCIDNFGPERCMFESNFPVDSTGASYGILWNAFKRISKPYSDTERAAIHHDTATQLYNL